MSQSFKVLSQSEIDHFLEKGYVILRDVFPGEVAARAREILWQKIGLDARDPATWTQPMVHHKEVYGDGPFAEACTQRLWGAYDDLMGEGRYIKHTELGWWPVTFPGFHVAPWQPPQGGWHVDGAHFSHRVNSREQGLLPIMLFSDIAPGGGGTALKVGSHRVTARILAEVGEEGLHCDELSRRVVALSDGEVVECIGNAGDVVLNHPFLLHTTSFNTGNQVRFICNPCYALHEPMQLDRADERDYSPVELAIRQSR